LRKAVVDITPPQNKFRLKATVRSANARAVKSVLESLVGKGSVSESGDDLLVEAEMDGPSARDLNRTLLSALRRVEKKTSLRAEWTGSDKVTARFFDYALKKTILAG